jgi:hypothetical protein
MRKISEFKTVVLYCIVLYCILILFYLKINFYVTMSKLKLVGGRERCFTLDHNYELKT